MAMPLPLVSGPETGQVLADLFVRTAAACPDPANAPPALILSLPTAWTNKYQLLLYKAAARRRMAVAGVTRTDALAHVSWPGPVILHAHWFASAFAGASSETQAMALLRQVMDDVERFRARNDVRLVWTAHNVFPHGNQFPETFLALRRWIFRTFDAVHVMHDAHVPLLETAFGAAPRDTFTVPHMLYSGAMPDTVDRVAARAHFGLPGEALVFAAFGSIQRYKRLDLLVQALSAVAARTDRPIRALIGGIPSDTVAVRELQQSVGVRPDITFLPRQVQDHEIQYFHHAADAMILPYGDTLNSGAAHMAASFGRPFLMPRGAASAGLEPLGAVTFDPEAPHALEQAMATFIEAGSTLPVPDPEAQALRSADRVSEAFLDALARVLDQPPSARPDK